MTHIPRSGGLAGSSERSGLAARLSGKRLLWLSPLVPLLLLAVVLMGSAQPYPNPKFRAFDANGVPLVGGLLYTYAAGTTTPLATYTTQAGTIANSNPVVLDANGQADVWLTTGSNYKFVLENSSGVVQWTVDNIPSPSALNTLADGTLRLPDGTANAPALEFINDHNTGLYRPDAGMMSVSVSSGEAARFTQAMNFLYNGLTVTESQTNVNALTATGNGTGYGVVASGGTGGGDGVQGTGTGAHSGVMGLSGGAVETPGKYAAIAGFADGGTDSAYFENQGTGLALEVHGSFALGVGGTALTKILRAQDSVNFAVNLTGPPQCSTTKTAAVTGAAIGGTCVASMDTAWAGPGTHQGTLTCTVTGANTVSLTACAIDSLIDLSSAVNVDIVVFQP